MSAVLTLSLGKRPEVPDDQDPIPAANPTDSTSPIHAATWQRMKAFQIAGTLNTASGFHHDRMTADFENGLLAHPPREIADGIFHTESSLFIGEWFDPQLEGKGGIVHGADFMYMISKLVDQTTDSAIESVTEIRFNGVVKNEIDIYISRGPAPEDSHKSVVTARIHLKNGADIYITAYDKPDKPITQRSASNTFAQHLCVAPLTHYAAAIKWAQQNNQDFIPPANFEIELKALSLDQQAAFNGFYRKNPTGLTASTALDIVITGTQVLAYLEREAGGIPKVNALGAGFSNVTLPPVNKLTTGCKLRLTVLRERIRTTERAKFWPIQFTFLDSKNDDAVLGQGTFNWVNRLRI